MSNHHELKEFPEFFVELWARRRKHEVRLEDRPLPFAIGDTVLIREWFEGAPEPTGRYVRGSITAVSRGRLGNARLPPRICVFTFAEHSRGGGGLADSDEAITPRRPVRP